MDLMSSNKAIFESNNENSDNESNNENSDNESNNENSDNESNNESNNENSDNESNDVNNDNESNNVNSDNESNKNENSGINNNNNNNDKKISFINSNNRTANNTRDSFFRVPVDSLHILKKDSVKETQEFDTPHKYYLVKLTNGKQYITLDSSGNEFSDDQQKYSYLFHAENAFNLIHQSLCKVEYYSILKPFILYKIPNVEENPIEFLTKSKLKSLNESERQVLVLGISTALYYLFRKGYVIPNFSLDYVFLENNSPKIYGYVMNENLDFDQSIGNFRPKIAEKEVVKQLSKSILEILNSKRTKNSDETMKIPSSTNQDLYELLRRVDDDESEDFPGLRSFSDFFFKNDYVDHKITNDDKVQDYLHLIEKTDLIDLQGMSFNSYDFYVYKKFSFSTFVDEDMKNEYIYDPDLHYGIRSLIAGEKCNIPAFLWPQMNIFQSKANYPFLNRVPENTIKNLVQFRPRNSNYLFEMLCFERNDLLFNEFPDDSSAVLENTRKPMDCKSPEDYFRNYQEIILAASKETKIFANQKPYFPIAISHLKKAAKGGHREATIFLANQYYKGKMIPCNYEKAISLLSGNMFADDERIKNIIGKIQEKLDEIKNSLKNLDEEQTEIYKKAREERNPMLMAYIAFAFFSGLHGFPRSASHSVKFYRRAAKLSPDYMCLLGILYFRGIIFPRNLKRAQNCFKRSAVGNRYEDGSTGEVQMKKKNRTLKSVKSEISLSAQSIFVKKEPNTANQTTEKNKLRFSGGSIKGKILDSLLRKHLWRSYMNSEDIVFLMNQYLQSPSSLSFDDTMIFPTAAFLSEQIQIPLFYDTPIMNSFYYYDDRNYFNTLKRNELKLHLTSFQYPLNVLQKIFEKESDEFKFNLFAKAKAQIIKSDIQVQDVNFEIKKGNKEDVEKNQIDALKRRQEKFGIINNDYTDYLSFLFDKDYNRNTQESTFPYYSISYFPSLLIPRSEDSEKLINKSVNKDINLNNQNINKVNAEIWTTPEMYSTKICLSPEVTQAENEKNPLLQLRVANCYFDGICGYPVNYREAARFYKMSADNGNSEAQWKYAQMCANGLGTRQDPVVANEYFTKSADQRDEEGMLRYALFVRHFLINSTNEKPFELQPFQQFIERSADKGNIEAIHQLGICFESNFIGTSEITKALEKYSQAADCGHIESLIRLSQLVKALDDKTTEEYTKYSMYSIGLFNLELILNYVESLNKKKIYKEARIIIDACRSINPDVFNPYLAESIALFHTDEKPEPYKRAERLLDPFLKYLEGQKSVNKKDDVSLLSIEKYIMVKIKIIMAQRPEGDTSNKYDDSAAETLLKFKDHLTVKSKDDFIEFYKKLDKVIARKHNITISFYLPDCREVTSACLKLKSNKYTEKWDGINELKRIHEENPNNPFALLKLGKLYMKGVRFHLLRNPPKAIDFIQAAAQKNIPEALFTCGKIYFYGYDTDPDTEMAFKYFWKAFDEKNRDPRAGYYLSEERFLSKDGEQNKFTTEFIDEKKSKEFLEIAADFGYKKALFKLGKIYFENSDLKKGCDMIKSASNQGYKEAKKFIKDNPKKFHNIDVDKNDLSDISISDTSS